MAQIQKCKIVALNASTNGDNTVIAASPGNVFVIWKIAITAAGAVNVTLKDGASTAVSGAYALPAAGSQLILAYDGVPYAETSPGNAFIINLSAGTAITGQIFYTVG